MKIVIFSGGSGTRMWPLSRKSSPKQFQNLIGQTSLFQEMVKMVLTGFKATDVFILTGQDYIDIVKRQVPEIPAENIIGEPEMRDTLAAVGFACISLQKKFPGETMAAIWGADHVVEEKKTFIEALKAAEKLANEKNVIAKVDVHPTFPNPHLGYIEVGKAIGKIDGFEILEFIRQVEKPNFETAEKFLEKGNYLWNTGYFVWPLEKIMELFKLHNPETYNSLFKIQEALGTTNEAEIIKEEYQKIPKISVDNALFVKLKTDDQLEISAVLGWADVGAWNIFKDQLSDYPDHNITRGEYLDIDSKDCLVLGEVEGKIIATIGLEGVIIVDTPDALLVCKKERSQDVKKIVDKLRESKKHGYL